MTTQTETSFSVPIVASKARTASRVLARLSGEERNKALLAAAEALETNRTRILEANTKDCQAAEPQVASGGMSAAMFARLRLKENSVSQMAAQVREVAQLPDPVGRCLSATELDNGLVLYKETCPFGVIAVIFESRPDVIPQVASLALKSANAILLKGGSEAAHTNEALVQIWREGLAKFPAVPADAIQLLQTRSDVLELLSADRDVDLIIPRGSYQLVQSIMKNTRIPVLGHGEGICHVYVDRAADLRKAIDIVYDSKVQYPAVCNAMETLLVHKLIAGEFLPAMIAKLREARVEVRGDEIVETIMGEDAVKPATEEDWSTEYGDLILSIRVVGTLQDAIDHINRYGSRHTDAIVTEDAEAAKRFMNEVDSASVFQNASTRFADGYRYGLGAEVGISNGKLHARGPMGLEGLVTYKYKLYGNGQTVADYASGAKKFTHQNLP